MAHDLVVRFDELDHVSSRLGQTAGELLFSPTDHPAPAHSATNGFPEVFNASLADLAADKNSFEVFSPDAFVEGEDDQGCGGDRGDGSGIEGDVLEGLEVLDQGVGPLGGSPH